MTRLEACMTKQNATFELVLANYLRWLKIEEGKKGCGTKAIEWAAQRLLHGTLKHVIVCSWEAAEESTGHFHRVIWDTRSASGEFHEAATWPQERTCACVLMYIRRLKSVLEGMTENRCVWWETKSRRDRDIYRERKKELTFQHNKNKYSFSQRKEM